MIKDNDVETTLENIKSYFETYVKTYHPYKNSPVFKALLDIIIEQYKELYINIPTNLLDLVVKNVITPKTNVDYLLFEVGLPEDLIHKLSNIEKWLFFQVFSNFARYKSTVNFFQMLCGSAETAFPDKFTLYELWVDRTNKGEWVLKPVVIYRGKYSDITTDSIAYDTVYQKIPSLLISKDQLEEWYQNDQIILPFKSNIILLGQYEIADISYLSGLIRATFLKQYKDVDISLYFNDNKKFVERLSVISKLWYYLVCRYYDFSQPQKVLNDVLLFSENNDVPEISHLEDIIDQFVNINSWNQYYQFVDTYISSFYVDTYLQESFTVEEYHTILTKSSPLFMKYIDERLTQCEDEKTEIIYLLDEIYGSLIVSLTDYANDKYYTKYLPVYLETLNRIFIPDINVSDPKTYTSKVALTLKPFHTEVLLDMYKKIRTEDKEFFDDIYSLAMEINKASVFDISAWEFIARFRFLSCSSTSIVSLIPAFIFKFFKQIQYDELFYLLISLFHVLTISSSDSYRNIFSKITSDSNPLISLPTAFMSLFTKTFEYNDLVQLEFLFSDVLLNSSLDAAYCRFLSKITSDSNPLISFTQNSLKRTTLVSSNVDELFSSITVQRDVCTFTFSDIKQTIMPFLIRDKFPNMREIVFPIISSSNHLFSNLYFDLFTYNDIAKVCPVATLTSLLVSSDSLFRTFYNNIFDKYNWEQSIFFVKYLRWIKQTNYDISDILITQIPLTSVYGKIKDGFVLGAGFYVPFNITEQYLLQLSQFLLYTNYLVADIAVLVSKYTSEYIISFKDLWDIYPTYNFYIPHILIDTIFNFDTQKIVTSILNSISKYFSILNISSRNSNYISDTIDSVGNKYFINVLIDDQHNIVFTNSYVSSVYNANKVDTSFTTSILLDKFEQFSIDDSQYSTAINY